MADSSHRALLEKTAPDGFFDAAIRAVYDRVFA